VRSHRILETLFALILLGMAFAPLGAQPILPRGPQLPMQPQYQSGQPVSPVFEGWYQNPDGTYTLSFGYFNRNAREVMEIPLGPDNFIIPAAYDGLQPTVFEANQVVANDYVGRGWGVFGVVVPASWTPGDDVVWTLRTYGQAHSVPGRIGRHEYQLAALDLPMPFGSMPPGLRVETGGTEGMGPGGVRAIRTLTSRVGTPLSLTVWARDRWDPEVRDAVAVNLRWFRHQGPAGSTVTFSGPNQVPGAGGEATFTATFSHPGEYLLLLRAANSAARDSTPHEHCCWTNGYVRVTVAP